MPSWGAGGTNPIGLAESNIRLVSYYTGLAETLTAPLLGNPARPTEIVEYCDILKGAHSEQLPTVDYGTITHSCKSKAILDPGASNRMPENTRSKKNGEGHPPPASPLKMRFLIQLTFLSRESLYTSQTKTLGSSDQRRAQ